MFISLSSATCFFKPHSTWLTFHNHTQDLRKSKARQVIMSVYITFLSTYGSNNVCLTYNDSKPSESTEEVIQITVSIFYGYAISKTL